jgi:hypothetical protein
MKIRLIIKILNVSEKDKKVADELRDVGGIILSDNVNTLKKDITCPMPPFIGMFYEDKNVKSEIKKIKWDNEKRLIWCYLRNINSVCIASIRVEKWLRKATRNGWEIYKENEN